MSREAIIPTEHLQPTWEHVIGHLWQEVEKAKLNNGDLRHSYGAIWMATTAFQKLAIACEATALNIIVGNVRNMLSHVIEKDLGVNPIFAWKW